MSLCFVCKRGKNSRHATFATQCVGRSGVPALNVSCIECFTFYADGLNQQNSYLTKGRQSANNTLMCSSCGTQSVKSEYVLQ